MAASYSGIITIFVNYDIRNALFSPSKCSANALQMVAIGMAHAYNNANSRYN